MPIPSSFERLTRSSARDRVISQLQKWIIDGTFRPDEKLYDVELAETLDVSRTPIREAFQILEQQGFVNLIPGKETRVTTINKEDIFKIYPPLAMLESLNAKEAALKISASKIEELRTINSKFKDALEKGNSYDALELDAQFHSAIAVVADNPYVTSFTSILQMHASRLKYIFFQHLTLPAYKSVEEHEEILNSLKNEDPNTASEVMMKNWIRPMEEIAKTLENI